MNPAALKHGKGPKSTPVVSDGTLCTLGIAGRLSCFDAGSGRVLWQRAASGPESDTAPDFGTAMSPLILDGIAGGPRLIAHVGGNKTGALTAFDLATGKELWRWDDEGPGYSSPVLLSFDGVPQIVTQTREHVIAVDPANGKELWKIGIKTPYVQNIVTPLAHGDLLIVSGLMNPVKALRPRRGENGAWTAAEVWSNPEVDMYMSSPVMADGRLIGFTSKRSGQIFALDPATGKTLWLGEPRQGENALFIVVGDQLLVLNVAGELTIGAVDGLGWKRYEVADSATWAHPALLGSRLLIKDHERLTLWSFESPP
jgi:outer membrane protein assembly factor BamB